MKHILTIITAVFLIVGNTYAQNRNLEAARIEFRKGNYQDAVGLYNGAIATVSNQKDKDNIIQEREKSSRCWRLLDEAERYFTVKNYDFAIKFYTQVCSINAYDDYAKKQIRKCRQIMQSIAHTKNRDDKYIKALQKGDAESIKAFLKLYPNDKETGLLTFIISDTQHIIDSLTNIAKTRQSNSASQNDLNKEFNILLIQNCIAAGDAFYGAENIQSAQDYYDIAASYGNAEAIYKKALCYENSSEQYRNLIGLAAAGKYPAAERELQILIHNSPSLKYDGIVAKRMYEHLTTYTSDVKSAMYIYENLECIPIDALNISYYIGTNKRVLQHLQNRINEDNLLYQAGIILLKIQQDPTSVMQAAASKGNINAIKWLADKYNDAEYKRCYEYFLKKDDFTAYIKYLKGNTITSKDWHSIYTSRYKASLDRHEILLALVKSNAFADKYFFKILKNHLSLYSKSYWDTDVIKDIRTTAYAINSKRAPKILKLISKLKVKSDLYDIKNTPMYKLANMGCYDNQHEYVQPIIKEYIWSKTLSSAKHGYNSNSNPNNSTSTASKNSYSASSKSAITEDPIKALLDEAYNYYNGEGGVTRDIKKALSLARQAHKLLDKQKNPYIQTRSFTYKKGTVNVAYTGLIKVCIHGRWGVIVQSYTKDAETMVIPCLFKEQEISAGLYNGSTYNERNQSGTFSIAADKLRARVQTYSGGGKIIKTCY